jgi:hypothetical protein
VVAFSDNGPDGEAEVETYRVLNAMIINSVLHSPDTLYSDELPSDTLPPGTFVNGLYTPDRFIPAFKPATIMSYSVPEPSTYLAGALLLVPFGRNALRAFGRRKLA